ncbi:MAG: acyl--CoA ligase [Ruminococcus sp.]|nr:acyl--CoA ligase [Ruminococcus sp.]
MEFTRDVFAKYCSAEDFAKIKEYDTVSQMWIRCVEEYADSIAIEDDGEKYSFLKIDEDIAYFRTLLKDDSDKKLRVGIYARNSYDFVKAYLATVTLGYCAVILPPQLDAPTVFGCSMKFSLDKLVYAPDMEENLGVLRSQRPDFVTVCTAETADTKTDIVIPDGKDPCVIMFTGGTTGKPKGALLSNIAVMQGTVNGCYGYDAVFNQRYLLVLPLSHVFGLIRNLMTSLYTGSDLYICKNNKDMFKDVAVFRPTVLVFVPALAEMSLMLSKKFGKNMLGDSLKYIIAGAAAVSPYLIKEYETQLGVKLLQGYGLTESANLVSGNPESLRKPDSVGLPYPHQEFKIVDGELWLKGLNMMDGYVGEDETGVYSEDGWFKTGDLVRIDDEGFLYITGRIKEIIVLPNGENISPAEVEVPFNKPDFIQDSQVFEDVDENGAHFLSLEVVPRAAILEKLGVDNPMEFVKKELEKINQSLDPYQRVQKIVVRTSDFERTPSMKIKRYKKC